MTSTRVALSDEIRLTRDSFEIPSGRNSEKMYLWVSSSSSLSQALAMDNSVGSLLPEVTGEKSAPLRKEAENHVVAL